MNEDFKEMLEKARENSRKLEELDTFLHVPRSAIDMEAHSAFIKEHKHKDEYFGAIGGHISYNLASTSIGLFVSVVCGHCNKSQDITDMSMF